MLHPILTSVKITMTTPPKIYDALIIGSGPAGLSVALGLARQLYTAVVFDSQQYRNHPADRMHNVITWDHQPPEEFRASARQNISDRYKTIEFRQARVETIRRLDDGTFEAIDRQQNMTIGKKVVLATGVTDLVPAIKGFSALWGKSMFVVHRSHVSIRLLTTFRFHCLFCHGYEEAGGQSAGIFASGMLTDPNMALHMAGMAASLAKDVVVYANGDASVAERMKAASEGKRVTVEPRKIVAIERKEPERTEVLVHFGDGEAREETFLVSIRASNRLKCC